MNRLYILFFIGLGSQQLYGTGQIFERIIYEGDTLALLSLPLEEFLGDYEERIV